MGCLVAVVLFLGCRNKNRAAETTGMCVLRALEAWSLRSGYQHGWLLVRVRFPACRLPLAVCSHDLSSGLPEGERASSPTCPFLRAQIPHESPPSWPHLTPVTPQRPHLRTPYHWELGLLRRTWQRQGDIRLLFYEIPKPIWDITFVGTKFGSG